jgi:hypothetical protein
MEDLNMKAMIIAGLFATLALWFGYNRGYHHGAQMERRAWESTAQPATVLDTAAVTLDNDISHVPETIYKNPHEGVVVEPSRWRMPVNAPDPRNVRMK